MSEDWKKFSQELLSKVTETASTFAKTAQDGFEKSEIKSSVDEVGGKIKDFFLAGISTKIDSLEQKLEAQNQTTQLLVEKVQKLVERIDKLEK